MGSKAAERGFFVLLGLCCILLLTACVPLAGAQRSNACNSGLLTQGPPWSANSLGFL